jgi:two-component system, sensor histidine kinase LadS
MKKCNCGLFATILVATVVAIGLFPSRTIAYPLVLTAATERAPLAGHLEVLKDETGKLGIEEVTSPGYRHRFTEIPGVLTSGFYQRGAIWLRCVVQRVDDSPCEWILELGPSYNERLDLYIPLATGGFDVRHGGALRPFSGREISNRLDLFKLPFHDSLPVVVHIRIESKRAISANPVLWQSNALSRKSENEGLIHGAYIGIIAFVSVLNLLYLIWFRKKLYVYYFFYIISVGYLFINSYGYAHHYIMTEKTWLIAPVTVINFLLLVALNTLLLSEMLELRNNLPRTDLAIKNIFIGLSAIGIIIVLFGFHYQIIKYVLIILLLSCLVSIIVSSLLIRRVNGAVLYLSAFGVLLLSGIIQVFANLGIISNNSFLENMLIFSTLVHIIGLNSAIIKQIVGIMREKFVIETALAKEQNMVVNQRQFLRLISHELRTPLAIIDSTAQIIPIISGDREQVARNTKAIRAATRRLSNLMDNYLTHERMEHGGLMPEFKMSDIVTIIQGVIGRVQQTTDNHQISFDVPDAPLLACCDPLLTEMLVTLLLDNAVKYSPDGGEIVFRVFEAVTGHVSIEIRDSGAGMARDQMEKIFDPFFRTNTIPGVGGVGLGLHLARHIAQLHGGSISCSSVIAEGTVFTVNFPSASPSSLATPP